MHPAADVFTSPVCRDLARQFDPSALSQLAEACRRNASWLALECSSARDPNAAAHSRDAIALLDLATALDKLAAAAIPVATSTQEG